MSRMLSASILHQLDIQHPRYEQVERQLFTQLAMGAPGSVVLLIGPTQVGKSRLIKRVAERLVAQPPMNDDRPVVIVEAATTINGRFSMKHLTLRALQELAHPMAGDHAYAIRQSESETQLRLKLEKAIRYRNTRYLIIDEAHHLLRASRTQLAAEALDSLKCLANTTSAVLVLAGGYELFAAGLSSAHLNGRMRVIEFGRYRPEGEDLRQYLGILKALDACLPWRKEQSLLKHADFILLGTLGCLGLLLQWINAAMCEMTACGERTLDREHFARTRYEEQVLVIANEIAAGEAAMKHLATSRSTATSTVSQSNPKGHNRRPFQRKPQRDAVGTRSR